MTRTPTGNPTGRPHIGKRVVTRLPEADLAALDELAEHTGSTRADLIRIAIRELLYWEAEKNRPPPPDDLFTTTTQVDISKVTGHLPVKVTGFYQAAKVEGAPGDPDEEAT